MPLTIAVLSALLIATWSVLPNKEMRTQLGDAALARAAVVFLGVLTVAATLLDQIGIRLV